MVVDGDAQDFFRAFLADDVVAKLLIDFLGGKAGDGDGLVFYGRRAFLFDDALAEAYAFITDVDFPRPCDQPLDLMLRFPTKGALVLRTSPSKEPPQMKRMFPVLIWMNSW